MATPVTLEDIYQLFQRSQEEADRRFAEADRRAAEAEARFEREMAASQAEYDRRIVKAEAIAAQANRAVNNLSSRWGQFVENMVAPAAVRLFREQGIAVNTIYQRARAARDGRHLEIDILAVDDTVAVVIEVKSRLIQEGVQQCMQTLGQFKGMFPKYQDYDLYGAVAAIEIDGGVDTYAANQGLFVIRQSGESVEISNPAHFRPRTW